MKKIAIIEDEKALLEVLAEKFRSEGFNVATAENGKDAIDFIKRENPDILLLDILLPFKDGFSILEDMKADPATRNIPVYILTNLGEDENVKKAIALGAENYFVKTQHPINEVFDEVVKRLLTKSK